VIDAALQTALSVTLALLGSNASPTHEEIRGAVEQTVKALPEMQEREDELLEHAQQRFAIFVPRATSLEDRQDHVPWLADWKAANEWRFWRRYRALLESTSGSALPPRVVRRLDEVTDDILSLLEDPARPGPWDRRGMVVGQVQSGKTSNFIGLLAKAADSGYRLMVVLAGLHNSLRSQTQLRVDEGLLGYDTRQRMNFDLSNIRTGVGQLPGFRFEDFVMQTMTNSSEKGDFHIRGAQNAARIGSDPFVVVVKKNATVLRYLLRWATALAESESGHRRVRDFPLLVIDDEADYASVNTKVIPKAADGLVDEDFDPTRINGLIRQLLDSFERAAYVGYTATPFANIYIPASGTTSKHGGDLFPRSFILNLPPPSDYVGPARVFGIDADPEAGIEGAVGMPVIRDVSDADDWIPERHTKELEPGTMAPSLRRAMLAFILACAARRARGQVDVHNSMLVHVTRFVNVQSLVKEQVAEELAHIKNRIRYAEDSERDAALSELRDMWMEDFAPTSRDMRSDTQSWDEIQRELVPAAERIVVRAINGTAADALEYYEHPDGISVIAIGGDKLSRGLTLEGLVVSYYLRASRTYDTLMQMGRWFGYRPGYQDLCRLYTTAYLVDAYRDIALAEEELRQQFELMGESGQTPTDFGLKVRNHSSLLITAASKMRSGRKVSITFAGDISETVVFSSAPATLQRNIDAVETLIRPLGPEENRRATAFWRDVPGEEVREFFDRFSTHPAAPRANAKLIAQYIASRLVDGELDRWTVALISVDKADQTYDFAGMRVGLTTRSPLPLKRHDREGAFSIRRILSPPDEFIGLDPDAYRELLREEQAARASQGDERGTDRPSGARVRMHRDPREGLLLIYPLLNPDRESNGTLPVVGFAASFPGSKNARAIEYTINEVLFKDMFFDDEFVLSE
jgi:hypothetical protein